MKSKTDIIYDRRLVAIALHNNNTVANTIFSFLPILLH